MADMELGVESPAPRRAYIRTQHPETEAQRQPLYEGYEGWQKQKASGILGNLSLSHYRAT